MNATHPIVSAVNATKRILTSFGLALAVLGLGQGALANPGDQGPNGTTILHFTFNSVMTNSSVDPEAKGTIAGNLNHQGNANYRMLKIALTKLTPNSTYQLAALLGDDTNTTRVAEFTTTKKGAYAVTYVKRGWSGTGGIPFPDVLNQFCNVRELSIINANRQTVLRADLTDPDKLHYTVNCFMANPGFIPKAVGSLRIDSTKNSVKSNTQFRLTASGLTAQTDFQLAINGTPVQTNTSDRVGRLTLTALPVGSKDVLAIHLLTLTDRSGSNVVLTTDGLGIPCDTTAPTVSFTIPANGATNVSINEMVAATFSEEMNPLTITNANFTLKQGATTVAGIVRYDGVTTTFAPTLTLTPQTTYTAMISTGVKDLAGNELATAYLWTFTTGSTPDTTPPTVSSTVPASGTTLAINGKITVLFSEAINPLTITPSTFTVLQGETPVAGAVTYDGFTATFTPGTNLAPLAVYTATLTTGVRDLAGNALGTNYVWTFTSGATPDTTPPTVSSTVPAIGDTGVGINQKIAAIFSEEMDPLTISTATFTMNHGATVVTGAVTYAGVTATFSPISALAASTVYQATLTTGAKDLAGNALVTGYSWFFTTGPASDTNAPMVTATINANGATNVPINTKVGATFSKVMDPLTITATTFTFMQGSTPVAGTVTYSGVSAVFSPATNLTALTLYTAKITTGAKDLAGNALASDYVWSWTTGATPDTTPPTVSSTIPANTTTNVAISQHVAAVFSEALDPLTISTATFSLKQGATPVAGTVSYVGVTATFAPSTNLAPLTVYTATITNLVKDLAGNALVTVYSWNFTTGVTPDTTPPTVSSTVPANTTTNVAISGSIAAVFSEVMDPLTISTATFSLKQGSTPVVGTVSYVGVTATFAPSTNLAPLTVYTATITNLVKDLAGNALVTVYSWNFTTGATPDTTPPTVSSTVPANTTTNVAISGSIAAVFSEAMDPLTISTATFSLKQGTTPVAGTVSYAGVTATFNPATNMAPLTVYTATVTNLVKDLAGNALVTVYSWNFTTGATPDTTPPTVSSTIPANTTTNVAISQHVAAVFSEAMDPLTISTATFSLKQGATPVAGTVSYVGVTATFAPATNMAPLTVYTATITNLVKDLAGNALVTGYSWFFTTGTAPDTNAPTVTATINANGATNVPINTAAGATFSEAMDPLTISTATFTLRHGTNLVAGTVTYSGVSTVFTPATNLLASTLYTATITTGAKDLAGNALANNYVWSWTTGLAPDTTPPTVSSTIPANTTTNVAISGNLAATFSEAMDPLTISTATFSLKQGAAVVTGTVSYAGVTATFNPASDLAPLTVYTATITNLVKDLAGNALVTVYSWNFTTGVTPDTTPPTVSSTMPTNGAAGLLINQKIAATFSEAMDPLTISTATFTLQHGITAVTGAVNYASGTATFAPLSALTTSTLYTATITTGGKDLAGNALATNKVWSFTTGSSTDTNPPTVILTNPSNTATNVSLNQTVNATLSESMDPLTVSTANFTVTGPGGATVTGTVAYIGASQIASFTPTSNLSPNTTYTNTVTIGFKDLAGNALATNYVWSFTTGSQINSNNMSINLGSAGTFAIMANATITGGGDDITGDVGLHPGSSQGIPPSEIHGIIHVNDTAVINAQAALLAAYTEAVNRSANAQTLQSNLGGLTKTPGLYVNGSSTGISGTGANAILTLDAQGDANAVFVFKMASTLILDTGTSIVLSGGAQAKNVYFQVGSSATLTGNNIFKGNILAAITITVNAGSDVEGRLFAGSGGDQPTGAVTVQSSTVTVPAP